MTGRQRGRIESKKRKLCALFELINQTSSDAPVMGKRLRAVEKSRETDGVMLAEPASNEGRVPCGQTVAACGSFDHGSSFGDQHTMTDEELRQLRAELRARQKAAMMVPKLFLDMEPLADEYYKSQLNDGPRPSDASMPPLFLMDVQHLLLFALMGNLSSYRPRWCQLLRVTKVPKVVLVVVDGLGSDSMVRCTEQGSFVGDKFDIKLELVSPHAYGATSDDELFKVPVTGTRLIRAKSGEKRLRKYYAPEESETQQPQAMSNTADVARVTGAPSDMPTYLRMPEIVPRTELLLNWTQMIREGYPLGLQRRPEYAGFVYTKSRYSQVADASPLYAIDCEMCRTVRFQQELTRVSVVDEHLHCIYDTFVKPRNAITDYLTRYSGITEEILRDVTTRIEDVQKELQRILPKDAILIGQSLNNDLVALKVFHPYCIDTSVVFNLRGLRHMKTGLKQLMAHFLGKTIQAAGPLGHNSIEDARSAMELVLLKLRCGIDYGDAAVGGSLEPLSFIRQAVTSGSSQAGVADGKLAAELSMDVRESTGPEIEPKPTPSRDKSAGEDSQLGKLSAEFNQKRKDRFLYRRLEIYDDFFELLGRCGKEAGIVGSAQACRSFKASKSVEVVIEEKNHKITKHALDLLAKKHFTYVRYWAGKGDPVKLHEKVDRRVGKIYTALPTGSLLVVLLLPPSSAQDGPAQDIPENVICCATLCKESPATVGAPREDGE